MGAFLAFAFVVAVGAWIYRTGRHDGRRQERARHRAAIKEVNG
jgi:hypothetical protein